MIKRFLDKVRTYLAMKNNTLDTPGIQVEMPGDLKPRIRYIKEQFKDCSDVVFREFDLLSKGEKLRVFLFYVDGLADKNGINDFIMKSLMLDSRQTDEKINLQEPDEAFDAVKNHLLSYTGVEEAKTYEEMFTKVLSGETALLIDGHPLALMISTRQWEHRQVTEPVGEMVVKGPHEGFVETLRVNTALLRRRIRSPHFKLHTMQIGKYTKTDVVVGYIEGIADPKIVEEVKNRLAKIEIDGVLDSGYIEELIEDNNYSPFPQIEHTERPDKVAASLLEGRVCIMVDGSPLILLAPAVFWTFLQASEDYYQRYYFGTATRLLRIMGLLISLLGPSVYIAVTTFHQEMLPTPLLISIAAQREGVPFPAVIEAMMLEIAFEILREAGVRLPKPVGQAVSIVGALIIGQAAVEAGLVSAAMVIVVAITGIASMTIPAFNMAISFRLLRFPLMIAASVLGFYGIMLVLLLILTHLCALRSFGTPYLSPIAPMHIGGWKDVAVRVPWWRMLRRPRFFQPEDITRQKDLRGKAS